MHHGVPDTLISQCRMGFAVYLLGLRVVLIDILAAHSVLTWLLVPVDIALIVLLTTWRTAHREQIEPSQPAETLPATSPSPSTKETAA
jgi:hypothetical protein